MHHPISCPWGRVRSAVGNGNWRRDGRRVQRETGDDDSFLDLLVLNFPSPQLELTNQPARSRLATPATTPVLDPSVLAEMGDTCTNGTHPPEIQALPPSFMSIFLQTTVSRVWPSPTHHTRSIAVITRRSKITSLPPTYLGSWYLSSLRTIEVKSSSILTPHEGLMKSNQPPVGQKGLGSCRQQAPACRNHVRKQQMSARSR